MPTYQCKIGTVDGRILERIYDSRSRDQLRDDLEDQGVHVFQIKRRFLFSAGQRQLRSSHVSRQRFLHFNRELLALLKSGLPVLKIFDTQLEQMEAGAFREVISAIREDIKGGSALSEAFGKYPIIFPPLYVAALKAGEKTGDLPETLTRYLVYQKRIEAIRARVRNASFYPLLLTTAAIGVVIFLMLYVVPRFSQIYADAQVELPLMTRIMISVSHLGGHYWYLLLGGLVLLVLMGRSVVGSSRGRLQIDRMILRVPFLGPLKRDYALSGFCRTLATTFNSGIPLVEAMQMSRGTLDNLSLERAMVEATQRVEEGASLSDVFARTGFFPPLATRMVHVGETSGSMSEMLGEISDYYESEVEIRLDRLTSMIEPVLMMVMGLLIAFIIVAMYVPIFQLAGTVG